MFVLPTTLACVDIQIRNAVASRLENWLSWRRYHHLLIIIYKNTSYNGFISGLYIIFSILGKMMCWSSKHHAIIVRCLCLISWKTIIRGVTPLHLSVEMGSSCLVNLIITMGGKNLTTWWKCFYFQLEELRIMSKIFKCTCSVFWGLI